jgi:hypothetical protein
MGVQISPMSAFRHTLCKCCCVNETQILAHDEPKHTCRVLGDAWVFNALAFEWKHIALTQDVPAAREMAAGAMLSEHQLLVSGGRGCDGTNLADACLLDLSSGECTQLLCAPMLERCAHTAVACSIPGEQVPFFGTWPPCTAACYITVTSSPACRAKTRHAVLSCSVALLAMPSVKTWCGIAL